jgi:hypothetical protein
MSQRTQLTYVTSVSGSTVVPSPHPADPPSKAGLGIQQVTIKTTESTADPTFYGATGTCANIFVIFQKHQ